MGVVGVGIMIVNGGLRNPIIRVCGNATGRGCPMEASSSAIFDGQSSVANSILGCLVRHQTQKARHAEYVATKGSKLQQEKFTSKVDIRNAGVTQLAMRMHILSNWQFPWSSGAARECQHGESARTGGTDLFRDIESVSYSR